MAVSEQVKEHWAVNTPTPELHEAEFKRQNKVIFTLY